MNWFGIDFGTTNTSACDALTGRTFGDGLGAPLPSIIAIDKVSDSVLTGRDAWERRFELKDRGDYEVIRSVKPCLDTFTSKQGHRGRIWEVVDVVALVLETLKKNIATASGSDVTTATFGVPVDLTPSARRTLRAAALQAGIAVSTFVKESTAAIISEWANVKGSRNVAVFDWGGGTLDVSVTQMQGSKIAELATKGVPVAGNVIDEEIAQFVHGRIMRKRAVSKDLTEISPPVYNDLLVRCENAKCTLSEVDIAHFSIFQYDRQDEVVELTREELRPLLAPFVSRALDTLFSAIREACLPLELIDRIIITGGCSKLWLFREALLSDPRLSARVVWAREPEWAVARGAAVLQKDPGAFELSESIAIELCDGAYLDLFCSGDHAGKSNQSLTLALVEEAKSANIMLHRRSRQDGRYSLLLPITVPVMGFDLEDMQLDLELTSDLTLAVFASSGRLNKKHSVRRETQELRFAYSIAQERGVK